MRSSGLKKGKSTASYLFKNMRLLTKFSISLALFGTFCAADVRSQTAPDSAKPVNFGYSRNPKTKNKSSVEENKTSSAVVEEQTAKAPAAEPESKPAILVSENKPAPAPEFAAYSSASETLEIAKKSAAAVASPTEIYKIGVGDVLFISIQNAPSRATTYFTVLNDGTIDYPLASEMVAVAGNTAEEIEETLKEKVKLYENPQISVKVREHASHSVTVLGLVEKSGEKFLQREAVPLYVIKAEAVVEAKANQLVIKRADSTAETLDLKDSKNEDVLVFPGDILEFKSVEPAFEAVVAAAPQFYYIGGEINSAGQKDFHAGITLTQAILASGGLRKPNVRRVIIRRKNEQGLLSPIQFDLTAVKDGKQPDPVLQAGDTLEIVK